MNNLGKGETMTIEEIRFQLEKNYIDRKDVRDAYYDTLSVLQNREGLSAAKRRDLEEDAQAYKDEIKELGEAIRELEQELKWRIK
jgi:hypothetical protein